MNPMTRINSGLRRSESCPQELFQARMRGLSQSALEKAHSLTAFSINQLHCTPLEEIGSHEIRPLEANDFPKMASDQVSRFVESLSTPVGGGLHPPFLELQQKNGPASFHDTVDAVQAALNQLLPNNITGYFNLLKISLRKAIDPNSFYQAWGRELKQSYQTMPHTDKQIFLDRFHKEFDTLFQLSHTRKTWDERLEYMLTFFREFGEMPDDIYERVASFILQQRGITAADERDLFDLYLFDLLQQTPFVHGLHVIVYYLLTSKEGIVPKEKILPLIKTVMTEEIKAANPDTLWRESTLATQLLSAYTRGTGWSMIRSVFLNPQVEKSWKTLCTGLSNLYREQKEAPESFFNNLATSNDYRLPVLMGCWVKAMLEAVKTEIDKPDNQPIFTLFKHMHELAEEKQIPDPTYPQLFLRIIVPAFKDLDAYEIKKDFTFLKAQQDFVDKLDTYLIKMLSQITQKHANDLKFKSEITQGKWLWMNQALEWLDTDGIKLQILECILAVKN